MAVLFECKGARRVDHGRHDDLLIASVYARVRLDRGDVVVGFDDQVRRFRDVITDAFEDYGVVSRTAYPEIPPRVEYGRTEIGGELRAVLDTMHALAQAVRQIDDERAVAVSTSCATARSAQA
ncbi:winged helix-turn-helix transcriptional regulator [Plantibacter sp. CFBP 13570]|nr:winged helix-turn-helix transcriptional regulator [Plantibacter sp. CFBP 13570]